MPKINNTDSVLHKELIAEELKERIYATLALLGILISVDPKHLSLLQTVYLICGTLISLWAASIVATRVSRRIIFQGELDVEWERERRLRTHAPMLIALVFPMVMLGLSGLGLFSITVAVNVSIIGSVFLLIGWSIESARSFKAGTLPTLIVAAAELLIGLAIVGFKVSLDH